MKTILFLVIGVVTANFVYSQSVNSELVSSGGESFSNSTYQLDWSVGECVTETYTVDSYVLSQGFHQNVYEITLVENLASDIDMTVYPNPTSGFLTVSTRTTVMPMGIMIITDINGKILKQISVQNVEEQLDFSNYVKGIYFLTIKQNNKIIKSFRIIKN